MNESEPVAKKKKPSSPPRGGPPKKIARRTFAERLRGVKLHLEEGFSQELVADAHSDEVGHSFRRKSDTRSD